jgi:hypothetical protein
VLWGSLHLALLLPGMMNEGASPLATLLLIGGSVLFTWLYGLMDTLQPLRAKPSWPN